MILFTLLGICLVGLIKRVVCKATDAALQAPQRVVNPVNSVRYFDVADVEMWVPPRYPLDETPYEEDSMTLPC